MQANPEKFQAISIGRKTHDKNVMFNLNGFSLSCEDEVKLLIILKVSKAIVRILRVLREGNFDFSNRNS
jgi:hypothetical protein